MWFLVFPYVKMCLKRFKKVGSPIYFLKKVVRESLKNTRALRRARGAE